MKRRWVIVAVLAAGLAVGATGFAASSGPFASGPPDRGSLGEYFLGRNMARAEVVMVFRGEVHDFRIDQGRVTAVRGGSLELLERDGTRQTVPVSPAARVAVNGQPATLASIAPSMFAVTVRDGSNPADLVRVFTRRS